MGYIGARVRGTREQQFVQGLGRYVGDLPLGDALRAGFVRSRYAHARLLTVDVTAARALPGVVALYTAKDLPEIDRPTTPPPSPPRLKGFFPLASDVVRHMGEPIAVVLAEDPAVLEDAIELVEVEYEPLDVVVDVEEAMGAPSLVWEDVPGNICLRTEAGFGDVEAAFREADVIVEGHFTFPRSSGVSLEPRAVAAAPGEEDGVRLTVWDSTQAPHAVRRNLAEYFGMGQDEVRVIAPDVGGGFGPKGRTYPEEFVLAALALRHQRPVRWLATRTEDLQTTGHGRGQIHTARLAVRADGTVLALEDRIIQDAGAYTPTGLAAPVNTIRHLVGPYRLSALRAELVGVYTNKTLSSTLRGGGRPEGVYVMERLLDRVADRLGLDRVEVRRHNFIPVDEYPYNTGLRLSDRPVVYDSGRHEEYLERLLELVDRDAFRREQAEARERGRYLGLGITAFIESTGTGSEGARVEVCGDGTVAVAVGAPSTGQSHATAFAQLAADRLGVDMDAVRVSSGDTSVVQGLGTFASRMALDGGNAISLAVDEVRKQMFDCASDLLEASPHDLEMTLGKISVRGFTERTVSLAAVARHAAERGQRLLAKKTYEPEQPSAWAGGVNAAVVEVDPETGTVSIVRYIVVHDSGVIINPMVVEGQVQGGVAHGAGNVLLEACVYDEEGQLLTSTLADYLIPSFQSVPRVEIVHFETPSPFNPEGIKGAGESGTIGSIPTIVSAIEDALSPFGVQISDMPIRPEDIVTAVQRSRSR